MAFQDGVKSAPIAYVGLVSVIGTFVVVLLLQVMYFGKQEAMLAADPAARRAPAELADLRAKQWTQLTRREVVDRERRVVTIGISRAMELVVQELSSGKAPAEVVGPPLPAASTAAPAESPAGVAAPVEGGGKQPAASPPVGDPAAAKSESTQE